MKYAKITLLISLAGLILSMNACKKESLHHANIWIPSAFSPNYDGQNDTFGPSVYELEYTDYSMTIIQDGVEVFKTKDLAEQWNGIGRNGNRCPIGCYLYEIRFKFKDNTEDDRVGAVMLID